MGSRRWLRGQSDVTVSLSAPRPLTTLGASRSTGPFDEVRRVYGDFATALDPDQGGGVREAEADPTGWPNSHPVVSEGHRPVGLHLGVAPDGGDSPLGRAGPSGPYMWSLRCWDLPAIAAPHALLG